MKQFQIAWLMSGIASFLFFFGMIPFCKDLKSASVIVIFTFLLLLIPWWMPKKMLEVID